MDIYVDASETYIQCVATKLFVVQSSDVADVIRRKLERLDSRAATIPDKGPVDAFTVIYQSGLARQISWKAQVEEAVKDENDEFWQKVTRMVYTYICYNITIIDSRKNSAI